MHAPTIAARILIANGKGPRACARALALDGAHWIVTTEDVYVLIHEMKHLFEGEWH